MGANVKEIEVLIDYGKIDLEVDKIYKDIDARILDIVSRVDILRDKEKILDKFIFTTHAQLESTDSKNFKLRNQLQISISKQLETQQLVTDTIIKYEKIIQDYVGQKQKVQNDKLSNYIKWKKSTETNADDGKFLEILQKFEKAVSVVETNPDDTKMQGAKHNELINSIVKQTYDEGYQL